MSDVAILATPSASVPRDYTIPGAQELLPKAVSASMDGTSAASAWFPCLEVLDPGKHVMFSAISDTSVAAGASADVSWFPKLKRSAATPAPSPNPLGTLWAWYDFSDSTTVTLDGSGNISQIADKTGNGHDLIQPASTDRPSVTTVNALNAGRFPHANNSALYNFALLDPLAQPFTVLGVFTQDVATFANYWPGPWGGHGADGSPNCFWNDLGTGPFFDSGSGSIAGTAVALPCTQQLITEIANGGSSAIRVNGTQTNGNLGTPFPIANFALGAQHYPNNPPTPLIDNYLQGKICEVLIYSSALSTAQLSAVESYLKAKWNTP